MDKLEKYVQPTEEHTAKKNESSENTLDYSEYLPAIDVEAGLKRLMNKKKLYITMLNNFLNNEIVQELIQNIQAGDAAKTASTAHALKGVAANLGFMELSAAATLIETQAKGGIDCMELIASLNGAFEKAVVDVQKLVSAFGEL